VDPRREASGPHTEDRRSPPRAVAAQLAVVVLLTAAAAYHLQHLVYGPDHGFFDLKVYRGAVGWWLDGRPLYEFVQGRTQYGFTYPPFAALLLLPTALVPQQVAAAALTAAGVAVVAVATWWLLAPVARRHGRPPWFAVAVALPVAAVLEPVRETLGFGQVNLLLAGLVLLDVAALRQGRRWAGVGIGLATAVKLTPGLFVLYLLLTGRRRAAGVAAGTALAATLVAAAVAPGTSWQFWTTVLWDTSRVGRLEKTSNQSLLGLLARLADPAPPNRAVWLVLAVAVLALAAWRVRQAARAGDDVAGVTLTGLTACLVSPISWTHHLVWVLPALVVLVDVAAGTPLHAGAPGRLRTRPRAVSAAAGAGALVVLAAFGSSVVWFFEQHPAEEAEGIWTWAPAESAYTLLVAALLVLLPIRRAGPPGRGGRRLPDRAGAAAQRDGGTAPGRGAGR
jgi:alpha-1,2-mannosyltransferase